MAAKRPSGARGVRPRRRLTVGRKRLTTIKLGMPRVSARQRNVAAGVGAICSAALAGFWFYNSPVMALHSVSVHGNVVVSDEVLREVASLKGDRLLLPGLDAAEARLESFPLIKDATVTRDWPVGARIEVVERTAEGVWQVGDQRYVIDGEGVVLTLPEPESAWTIHAVDASELLRPGDRVDPAAVAVAAQLFESSAQAIGQPVSRLEYSTLGGLTALLADETRIQFGAPQDFDFKIATLYAVLERARSQGESVRVVDLRFGNRVAVQ